MFKNSVTLSMLVLALTASLNSLADDFKKCPKPSVSIETKDRVFDQILLVPGAGAEGENLMIGYVPWGEYYSEVKSTLRDQKIKFKVLATLDHGNQSVEDRVEQVKRELSKDAAKGLKVLLLGHSMGGLVARIASRDPEFRDTIVGTLTLATPHHGTEMADWVLKQSERTTWIETISKWVGFPIDQKEYLAELSVKDASRWETDRDEDPALSPIFSLISSETTSGFMVSNPAFKLTDEIMAHSMTTDKTYDYATDGMVPARSQAFGVCLGWVEADHGAIIGKSLSSSKKAQGAEILKTVLEKLSGYGISQRH